MELLCVILMVSMSCDFFMNAVNVSKSWRNQLHRRIRSGVLAMSEKRSNQPFTSSWIFIRQVNQVMSNYWEKKTWRALFTEFEPCPSFIRRENMDSSPNGSGSRLIGVTSRVQLLVGSCRGYPLWVEWLFTTALILSHNFTQSNGSL